MGWWFASDPHGHAQFWAANFFPLIGRLALLPRVFVRYRIYRINSMCCLYASCTTNQLNPPREISSKRLLLLEKSGAQGRAALLSYFQSLGEKLDTTAPRINPWLSVAGV